MTKRISVRARTKRVAFPSPRSSLLASRFEFTSTSSDTYKTLTFPRTRYLNTPGLRNTRTFHKASDNHLSRSER